MAHCPCRSPGRSPGPVGYCCHTRQSVTRFRCPCAESPAARNLMWSMQQIGPCTGMPELVWKLLSYCMGLNALVCCITVHISVGQAGPPASFHVHMQDSQQTQGLASSQGTCLATSPHRKVILGPGGSSSINQGVVRWQELHCGHVCSMQLSLWVAEHPNILAT